MYTLDDATDLLSDNGCFHFPFTRASSLQFTFMLFQLPNSAIRDCTTETCMDGKAFHTKHGTEMSLLKVTQKTGAK